ncbi:MAG: peptidyl-prolyl cis-trans isomerase [Leptospirales bacterium]|nr:peptidyl-prolyl cis-trans isomerase [Leptospirales bacterium]
MTWPDAFAPRLSLRLALLLLLPAMLLAGGCRSTSNRASGDPGDEDDEPGVGASGELSPPPGSAIVNRVRIVVGQEAITDLDLRVAADKLRRANRLRGRSPEAAAADFLIERAIVEIEARQESILVSEERMQTEVRRRMQFAGVLNEEDFHKRVERESGLPWDVWYDDLRFEIIKRQLIQVKITVPQATDSEIEQFYRRNRERVGFEVRYREMIFAPRDGSIAEESRIAQLAGDAYNRAAGAPANFGTLAQSIEGNVSPLRAIGGLHDFAGIQEIAESDQNVAGILFNTPVGSVSRPFRDARGRYTIVKVEARRPIPLDKIRDLIRDRLYFEKEGEAFEEWIARRKREVAVQRPGG